MFKTEKYHRQGTDFGRQQAWRLLCATLGLVCLVSLCIALVAASPLAGMAIVAAPFLLAFREMPTFGITTTIVAARALVDGVFGFTVGGNNATALIGLALVALGAATAIRGGRGVLLAALMLMSLAVSNSFAVMTFGAGVQAEIVRTASIAAVLIIVLNSKTRLTLSKLTGAAQAVAVVPAAIALFQAATGTGLVVEGVVRPAGTLAHPNSAAVLFSVAALATMTRLLQQQRRSRFVDITLLVFFCAALLGTASMGGLLTFAAMTLALAVFANSIRTKSRLLIVGLVLGTAFAFILSPIGAERLSELDGLDLSGSHTSQNSLEWRVGNWGRILDYWRESPVFGQGFGATTTGAMMGGYLPHNEYVRLLVEVGIIGCLTAAILILMLFRRISRVTDDSTRRPLTAAMALAVIVGLLVNCSGANTFLYSVPTYVAVIVIAGAIRTFANPSRPGISDLNKNKRTGNLSAAV